MDVEVVKGNEILKTGLHIMLWARFKCPCIEWLNVRSTLFDTCTTCCNM
jgi:hypothetical protein